MEAALGIENVREREQIELIGPPAVVEEQKTIRRGRGGTFTKGQGGDGSTLHS